MSLSRQTLGCAETRNANDADVANSLKVVDATILKSTNSRSGWLRYNGDGYGDCHVTTNGCPTEGAPWAPSNKGTGHIWPVLSEERAQQELATGRAPAAGAPLNAIMAGSSGVGLMPEQDWDAADVAPSPYGTDPTVASIGFVNGKPAGSAAPLTWGAGSFVRLVADLTAHRSVETPSQTVDRYVTHQQHGTTLTVTAPADQSAATGTVTVTGTAAPGATIDIVDVATDHGSATTNAQAIAGADGSFSQAVTLATGTNTIVITSTTPDGATAQTTRTVVEDIVEGTLLYDAQDPTGDDNGPGNYAYPTASDFHPGAYDMTDFQVYDTGSTVTFRVQTRPDPDLRQPAGSTADRRLRAPARRVADVHGRLIPAAQLHDRRNRGLEPDAGSPRLRPAVHRCQRRHPGHDHHQRQPDLALHHVLGHQSSSGRHPCQRVGFHRNADRAGRFQQRSGPSIHVDTGRVQLRCLRGREHWRRTGAASVRSRTSTPRSAPSAMGGTTAATRSSGPRPPNRSSRRPTVRPLQTGPPRAPMVHRES